MLMDDRQGQEQSVNRNEVKGMTEHDKERKLKERIKAGYEVYIKQLKAKPTSDLIKMASEIAAAKFIYEELSVEGAFEGCVDYLLQAENPLELAISDWMEDQDFDRHEDLEHALWVAKETAFHRGMYIPEEAEQKTATPYQGVTMC